MAGATTAADYLSITETPGTLLNREQLGRMVLRYSLAAELGTRRRVGSLLWSGDWLRTARFQRRLVYGV